MATENKYILNYMEQKILIRLSNLSKKFEDKGINIGNKQLAEEFDITSIYAGLILGGLDRKGYICRDGKRGKGRNISVLKPQYKIV